MNFAPPLLAAGLLLLAACAPGETTQTSKFGANLSTAQQAEIRFLLRDGDLNENERRRRIDRVLAR